MADEEVVEEELEDGDAESDLDSLMTEVEARNLPKTQELAGISVPSLAILRKRNPRTSTRCSAALSR